MKCKYRLLEIIGSSSVKDVPLMVIDDAFHQFCVSLISLK